MDTLKRLHEKISALVDGELPDSELELAMAALATPAGRAAWRAYHLIGDALRAQPYGAGLDDGVAQRLALRLAAEAPLRGATARSTAGNPAVGAAGNGDPAADGPDAGSPQGDRPAADSPAADAGAPDAACHDVAATPR